MASTAKKETTQEGFWTKDEEYGRRLDQAFRDGQPMLVTEIAQDDPFTNPKTGQVIKTRTKMTVVHLDRFMRPFGPPLEYKTLASPIYDRAGVVAEGDFPCVCAIQHVEIKQWNNEAMILERLCDWPVPDATTELLMAGASVKELEAGTAVVDQ